jgi:hypothetical protein
VTEKIFAGNLPETLTVTSTVTRNDSQSSRAPSMNLEATQLLYFQGQTVTLVGSVYPPPPSSAGIALTTRNPLGVVVQVGQAETGITNGTFFYLLSTATSAGWVSGRYSVNATVGGQSATATFIYTASPSPRGPLLGLAGLGASSGRRWSAGLHRNLDLLPERDPRRRDLVVHFRRALPRRDVPQPLRSGRRAF